MLVGPRRFLNMLGWCFYVFFYLFLKQTRGHTMLHRAGISASSPHLGTLWTDFLWGAACLKTASQRASLRPWTLRRTAKWSNIWGSGVYRSHGNDTYIYIYILLYNMYHVFIAVSTAPMSICSCYACPPCVRKMPRGQPQIRMYLATPHRCECMMYASGVDRFPFEQCIGGVNRFAFRMHAW